MALTKAQRLEREANHKHMLRENRRWITRVEYVCCNFDDSDKDWGCNYYVIYSRQWIRDRVMGVPLREKKRPGHAQG